MSSNESTSTREFETVAVGDKLTPLICGPLTPVHLMRFSAAIENWHRIHYDQPFATGHDGLPGLLVSGSLKQHLVAQMLRDWAGPGGWLVSMTVEFRRMNEVGDTLTVWGTVAELEANEGHGLVTCEIGISNQAGVQTSPGSAQVALPRAGAGWIGDSWPPPGNER